MSNILPPVAFLSSAGPDPVPSAAALSTAVRDVRQALTLFHLGTGALAYLPTDIQASGTLDAMLTALQEWWMIAADAPDEWPTMPVDTAMTFGLLRVALISFVMQAGLTDAVRCRCADAACPDGALDTARPAYLVRTVAQTWHALSGCHAHTPTAAVRAAAAPTLAQNRQALRGLARRVATLSTAEYPQLAASADRAADMPWGREAVALATHGFGAWYGSGIVREAAIDAVRIARDLHTPPLTPAEDAAARRAIDATMIAVAMAGLADARVVEGAALAGEPVFTFAALVAYGADTPAP